MINMGNVDLIFDNISTLTDNLEHYLRPHNSLQSSWMIATKSIYDFTKLSEKTFVLPKSKEALPKLHTDDLDVEEVWQQVELQCSSLINITDSSNLSDETNLSCLVATLSNVAREAIEKDRLDNLVEEEEEEELISNEEILSDVDSKIDDKQSSDEGVETGDEEGDNVDDDFDDFEEPDNDTFSDLDADTFGDIALEGCESDDDSDDENALIDCDKTYKNKKKPENIKQSKDSEKNKPDLEEDIPESEASHSTNETDDLNYFPDKSKKSFPKKKSKLDLIKKFEKTPVDSQFLSVRESEWIADNDVLGENFDLSDGEEDIDMMKDTGDENEAASAMYSSFFNVQGENEMASNIEKPKLSTMKAAGIMNFGDCSDDNDTITNVPNVSTVNPPATMSFDGGDNPVTRVPIVPLIGDKTVETKSSFEKEREEEIREIEDLEMENLEEKPWHLKGEVLSENRPVNSTLEEHLEFNVQVRPKPIITEDVTTLMEKMILSRIRSKDFDDVERKVKPSLDPSEFKKKLVLEQDKSKLSLAQLYEQDYIKERDSSVKTSTSDLLTRGDEPAKELAEHKEIKKNLEYIFKTLNALSNYHYTPYRRDTEIKIVSNLPAVMLEESTPATASDATLLAPQEIIAPLRGDLKGDTELSKTDKLSRRRSKKVRQKYIGKLKEDKLKEGMKKKGKGGLMNKDTSIKVVEKAIKEGRIKMLNTNAADTKSSNKFFEKLNESVAAGNKKRKLSAKDKESGGKKKSKSSTDGINMKKLLL